MKNNISAISLTVIMVIMTLVSSNFNWGKRSWNGIIENDAKGYYAYLPAVFIYKDLNFTFFEKIEKEKYFDQNLFYDYRIGANGKIINKYYCGTALAELPFFLIAHGISNIFDLDTDGYSRIYPVFISLAALFYLFLGIFYLNKILKLFTIPDGIRAFVLAVCVFGTNLFYYTVSEPGMSHIYSFAFMCIFIYYSKLYFSRPNSKNLILLFLVLGLIVLIRPINGIIIFFLPFLANDTKQLWNGIRYSINNKIALISSLIIFFGIVSIQFILYKIATGNLLVYSYGEEGFNFLNPKFVEILFSYKKGLFLYTPIYLVSFVGLIFLWKKSKYHFLSWSIFFILVTYVFSSWWMWYYGGSFSSRVYVEYLSCFMILLALSLSKIQQKTMKICFISLLIILVSICQIQTIQYRYYAIHWSDMTKEKYWKVFLRLDQLKK